MLFLVVDEMKIHADLVFNKMTGEITGFVDYGEGTLEHKFTDLHTRCKQQKLCDREVATHMLTVMVRGLTFNLDLPIAHFATTGIVFQLYSIFVSNNLYRCYCRAANASCVEGH